MAINQITATGLTIQSVSDIVAELTAGYTSIYGSDINLDSNTPDGQMMNIYAIALEDNLQLLAAVNAQFSLANAFGVQVDDLVALNGIQRQAGTFTVTYVQVTVSQAITLPGQDVLVANPSATVAAVSDAAGNQYQLQTSYSFAGAGTATLAFIAVNIGQVLVSPNTITVIATPMPGWASVNNPAFSTTLSGSVTSGSAVVSGISTTAGMTPGMLLTDADSFFPAGTTVLSVDSSSQITASHTATGGSPTTENVTVATPPTIQGANEETDVALKVRQARSFALAATGPADTIRAQLLNTPGVLDAFVPENDATSIVNGVFGNGIMVVTNAPGVPAATIAQVIYSKKTVGAAQTGTFTTTGDTHTTTTIDGIPTTANMAIGQAITGSGIPINTTVASIVSATSITISNAATATASGVTLTITPQGTLNSYTITRPAGNTFTAYWFTALTEALYISFQILPINGVDTFDTTALAASLSTALVYRLNQSAFIGDVIRAMQVIAPNGYLQSVFVDDDPSPALQTISPSDLQHYFTVSAANITITT